MKIDTWKTDFKAFVNSLDMPSDDYNGVMEYIDEVPYGISLEWINKYLEWLDSLDNEFAQLAKVSIKTMVESWKKEQT